MKGACIVSLLIMKRACNVQVVCEQQLQTSEEQRVEQTKRLIHQVADIENSAMPILQRCIEGIRQASSVVNHEQVKKFIMRYSSLYEPKSWVLHSLSSCSVKCVDHD